MTGRLLWLVRGAAFVFVGYLLIVQSPAGTPAIVAYVLSGGLLIAWHRNYRKPYGLAALAMVGGALSTFPNSDPLIAMVLIAVLEAGTELPSVPGIVVAGCAVLAIEVGALVSGVTTGVILGYPLLVVVVLLAGRNRRSYRIQAEQAHEVAALAERTRIAREIHDVLAHSLGALGIQLQAARAVLTDDGDVERALGLLANAQRMATDGLAETRQAIHALRDDPPPLTAELTSLAEAHRTRHHSEVELHLTPVRLGPDSSVALARVAREALVNAAKHAAGEPVDMTLQYADGHVELIITNPLGTTGDLKTVDSGYGLTGMQERLHLRDGTLAAGPSDDGRWVVKARVRQ